MKFPKRFVNYVPVALILGSILGIVVKLTLLTGRWVYLYPVCYLDWFIIAMGSILLSVMYIKSVRKNHNC